MDLPVGTCLGQGLSGAILDQFLERFWSLLGRFGGQNLDILGSGAVRGAVWSDLAAQGAQVAKKGQKGRSSTPPGGPQIDPKSTKSGKRAAQSVKTALRDPCRWGI